MVNIDLDRIIVEATEKQMGIFKETIRLLQQTAWEEGHSAYKEPCSANPYLKENDNASSS